jgi:hypothetical protein
LRGKEFVVSHPCDGKNLKDGARGILERHEKYLSLHLTILEDGQILKLQLNYFVAKKE